MRIPDVHNLYLDLLGRAPDLLAFPEPVVRFVEGAPLGSHPAGEERQRFLLGVALRGRGGVL